MLKAFKKVFNTNLKPFNLVEMFATYYGYPR